MVHAGLATPRPLPADAEPADGALTAIAREVTGRPRATVRDRWVEPVDYPIGTASTAGLWRVRGVVVDGGTAVPWSVFVKLLRSHRHLDLPAELQDMVDTDLTWRQEADLYRSSLDDVLPAGLRLPVRYRIDDLPGERVVEWLEDVRTASAPWDLPRFARAARLLGRLAVRLTGTDPLPASVSRVPGDPAQPVREDPQARPAGRARCRHIPCRDGVGMTASPRPASPHAVHRRRGFRP